MHQGTDQNEVDDNYNGEIVLVYVSILMVQLKASEAKGALCKARTSKCTTVFLNEKLQ